MGLEVSFPAKTVVSMTAGASTVVGLHLLSVNGISIGGHRSMIILNDGGETKEVDDFICFLPWGSYTPTRRALFSSILKSGLLDCLFNQDQTRLNCKRPNHWFQLSPFSGSIS